MRILALETQLEKAVAFSDQLIDAFLKSAGKVQSDLAQAMADRDALKSEVEGLRRILALRKKTASETMFGLIEMVDNAEIAKQMSCAELAEALRRKIGDQTPMDKLEYDLIEEAAGRLQHLIDQSDIDNAVMNAVELKRQRDALLEMTWLDLPSEPTETIAQWRKLFEEGWERRRGPAEPVDDVQDDSEAAARLRYLEGR